MVFYGSCSLKGYVVAEYLDQMVKDAGLDAEVVSTEIHSFPLWEGRASIMIFPYYPPSPTSASVLVEPLAYAGPYGHVLEELGQRVIELLQRQVER